ncbi:MAG TPA: glycosyltransferase family 4 protein [Acidimicrobiales bacterium]|nr:glycosyltransferase family 4 protein [Acidimicrobiales bacterium]
MVDRESASVPAGRVLHVLTDARARGAQVFARALADRLSACGQLHELLGLYAGPQAVVLEHSLGLEPRRLPAGSGLDLRVPGALRRACRRLGPSLVVAHGGDPLKYLALAAVGSPLVFNAIGTVPHSLRRPHRRWAWRQLVSRAELVVAVSEAVANEQAWLFGLSAPRLVTIPNGREPEVFRPPDSEPVGRPPTVAFVGQLTESKRPDLFVSVVSELRRWGLAFSAVAVGDGPMRAALEAPATQAGVVLLGSRSDVASLLRRIDVLVLPSRPTGEGMPGVLIEAGLSGVPVVATRVPGADEVVEHGRTGLLVAVDDAEALAQAVADLVRHPDLRRSMGSQARQRCLARFSLDQVASQWASALANVRLGTQVTS